MLLLCHMRDTRGMLRGRRPWLKKGATHFHAQLGLPDKGRTIKWLVVCNNYDLELVDPQNGLAIGCNQPSRPLRSEV